MTKYVVLALIVVGVGLWGWQRSGPSAPKTYQTVNVSIPQLSSLGRQGKLAFDANCATCHGQNAAGTDNGPPLVHDIYNPGHHADQAFFFAASRGARQHHWRFGNMPPQPQVNGDELAAIVRYVRELQLANGIVYREHRM